MSWPAVLALALALTNMSALAGPSVYGESLMVKVRPDTPPRPAEPVELLGARNEALSFQVVIHGGDTGASGVTARFDALEGPARIGGSQLTLYREDFLDITEPSGGVSAPGPWPDALTPAVDEISGEPRNAFPFDVPPNVSRTLWVEVLIPEDAPPGRYQGTVEVQARGGFTASVPVTLEVVRLVLPSTPSYPTAFGIQSDRICVAHTGRTDCGSDAVRLELLERYARLALDHRFTLSNVLVLQPEAGSWERFDAAYSPLLDGTAPTRLRGARMTSARYMGPLEDAALAAFVSHFSERGWLSRAYDYTGDEPPLFSTFDEVRARATMLERSAPGLLRMVTTSLAVARANSVDGLIGRMSVLIQVLPPTVMPTTDGGVDEHAARADYDTFLARPGTSLWLYQSCSSHGCLGDIPAEKHWPSYMVDHPANFNRAFPWTVFLLRASGETYYETSAQLPTAWTNQLFYGGNGDGTLFYPGTPERIGGVSHVPLPSLRLKLLRAGVQDYEWLTIVASAGDPAFAEQVAHELIPAPDQVPLEPAAFEQARARLIQRALELVPESPPAPEAKGPGVSESNGCGCDAGPPEAALAAALGGLLWALKRRRASRHLPRDVLPQLPPAHSATPGVRVQARRGSRSAPGRGHAQAPHSTGNRDRPPDAVP
ncbi:DUF4091 domain-containing protein [Pyxidicoccus parkwayensis]|uniref:DUF4091 domain-containing protein n=1 Tax=Pyxidicoccus parkwayensis TaxID=2813578 RepID=A0ABX7PA15_9BACT|nr:DUF4091 domain-containing protein [Pyxidicoccus parkwaysis]QSQ27325.1 DUF4091 domain-containing protein [Pyxidicoccus parkwaysis]